ncbi:MAG: response regulator transcription factor [Deltaproteobacteria bacterium]|nr:response regulator transcription factor [Deltaproteobacteria bacterium]
MSIKVMVAFSNTLFSEGVKALIEGAPGIDGVEVHKAGTSPAKTAGGTEPGIMLVDYATLYGPAGELANERGWKLLLVDTGCGEDSIVSAFISRGLKGVLMGDATSQTLKKALKAVADGEIWLDKLNVKNLIAGLHAVKKENGGAALSVRERDVVCLVGQGYRNKEIAGKLCISEPTVKTHMQRIFQKLDIHGRPQLITFAIKNQAGLRQG